MWKSFNDRVFNHDGAVTGGTCVLSVFVTTHQKFVHFYLELFFLEDEYKNIQHNELCLGQALFHFSKHF